MIFSDFGKMDRPPPEGSACTTLGPGNVPVAGVIKNRICRALPAATPPPAVDVRPTNVSADRRSGTCPPGYQFRPGTNYSCPPGAMCKPNFPASCRRDPLLQVVDSAIPATPASYEQMQCAPGYDKLGNGSKFAPYTCKPRCIPPAVRVVRSGSVGMAYSCEVPAPPVSPGVPVGPLVPKDCPPGQYRPIGSAIGAPCVPLPPSTPGVAPPLLGPSGSVRPSNLSADWKSGTCPTGYTFKPGAKYECRAGSTCSASWPAWCLPPAAAPTSQLIVNPQIVPPPPPQVAPQPVPPVTLPAPVPIPVQVQPGTAAAAAVDTINTAALMQAQLAQQQQVQAAQAGMGPALGIGAGGLLLLALLMR